MGSGPWIQPTAADPVSDRWASVWSSDSVDPVHLPNQQGEERGSARSEDGLMFIS